jgi:hypothetical protein
LLLAASPPLGGDGEAQAIFDEARDTMETSSYIDGPVVDIDGLGDAAILASGSGILSVLSGETMMTIDALGADQESLEALARLALDRL